MKNLLQLITLTVIGFTTTGLAAPGNLDWSFGISGFNKTHIFDGDDAQDIAIQPDGKILVAGTSGSLRYEFSLIRLNNDGTLDLSFGNNGAVRTAFDAFSGRAQAWCMALQPDGKIILGGNYQGPGPNSQLAVTRYMPDGSLDPTFGNGGKVSSDIGRISFVSDVVLQTDGKILLTGTMVNEGFLAVRLLSDGSLDSSFGGDGTVTVPPVSSDAQSYALALQSDNKILLGGYAHVGTSNNVDFAIIRLNPDGTLDTTFDGDGKVTTAVAENPNQDMASSLVVQPDGKILATGYSISVGFAMARYNNDGSLDPSFGNGGTVTTAVGVGGMGLIAGTQLQSDGKIVVSGSSRRQSPPQTNIDFTVARYRSNGTLDTQFGNRGIFVTPLSSSDDKGRRLAIQNDGKFVVAGYGDGDFLVARYLLFSGRVSDFDGDVISDLSTYQPRTGVWSLSRSRDGTSLPQLGTPEDRVVPADYDGDGKWDTAVFSPSSGSWRIVKSSDGSMMQDTLGSADVYAVPSDYDGDGKADVAIYDPHDATWELHKSSAGAEVIQHGYPGDIPVASDYDGDGKTDLAVFTPATATWSIRRTTLGEFVSDFGSSTDTLVPADYDGDGKSDLAVYRNSTYTWYIWNSSNQVVASVQLGSAADLPVPADYDGDGRSDVSVYSPADSTWRISRSTAGSLTRQWGASDEFPIPFAFVRATTVSVSGRVLTPDGLALRNASVYLTNSEGTRRSATTSSFGIFSFENIRVNESYALTVASKRYRFAPKTLQLQSSHSNLDFIGLE